MWLADGSPLVADTNALIAAVTALVIAIGGTVGAIAGLIKVLRELKKNTQISEIAAITGESTHQMLHEQEKKSEGSVT